MKGGVGAVILTGGASARMGFDKARLEWRGRTAVDRAAAVARALGAHHIVTVGPEAFGWPNVMEDTPRGGPVGGVLAGAAALRALGAARALVLAVDAPTVLAEDLAPLLACPSPGAAYDGLPLPMVVDLDALPHDAPAHTPLRDLVSGAGLSRPVCAPRAVMRVRGANTPEERAALLAELTGREDALRRIP